MALDFPNSPSVNQSFNAGGKIWVYNGNKWVLLGTSLSQTVPDGSITQAKLGTSFSGVTVTTSANRSSAVPSPFTGQLVFLTDTKKVQVWDGSAWLNITLAPPETPTSLSATALSTTSVSVAFTAGGANGSPITNYKYALSTNGGASYGAFTALDPADALTPITISGLTAGTTYHIKLKAVNDMGDSVESSATSVATLATPDAPTNLSATPAVTTVNISFTAGSNNGYAITNYQYALSTNGGSSYGSFTALDPADGTSPITITGLTSNTAYYVKLKAVNSGGAGAESSAVSFTTLIGIDFFIAGGGGTGGQEWGGGGGGGGTQTRTSEVITLGTSYAAVVGGAGSSSSFFSVTANAGTNGGNGGGTGGTSGNGFAGRAGRPGSARGSRGGGSTATGTNGGAGEYNSFTGTAIGYCGGGTGGAGGGQSPDESPTGFGAGEGRPDYQTGTAGTANTGGGGGGGGGSNMGGGAGGSGVLVIRYQNTRTITVGAGLTASHTNADAGGGNRYTRLISGSGNVSWS